MSPDSEPPRAAATFFAWAFRSRSTGRITVAQRPNLTLSVFLVATAVDHFASDSTRAHTALAWLGELALAAWAVDEVVRGVNPWRRVLGLGVSGLVAARFVTLVH
jgi:hypothetical protein